MNRFDRRRKNMKKILFLLLITIVAVALVACENERINYTTPLEIKDVKPVQSFGNQRNQSMAMKELIKDGDWIYTIDWSGSGEEDSIVRFPLDNPNKRKIIYQGAFLDQISIMNDWLFVLTDTAESDWRSNLYKMKKDGSKKVKIASEISCYILTEEEIYYETSEMGMSCVYAMSLEGSHKRKVLGKGHTLEGIDHNWIYYFIEDEEREELIGPYRAKADGTESESLLDLNVGLLDHFVVENEQAFFTRTNEKRTSLVRKMLGKDGKETVLISFPYGNAASLPVNKEGDWLYVAMGKELYKINTNGKEEKELVYRSSTPIVSILLYDGDVLLGVGEGGGEISGGIYIKQDGTVIDLR